MKSNTVPVIGEAMPISRRSVLAAAPAALVLAAVAPTAQPSSSVLSLIAAHKAAFAEFEACCNAADTMHPDYGGTAAERLWARNSERETRALFALLAFQSDSIADQHARASHLLTVDLDALMDCGGIETLLRSLAAIA